MSNQTVAPALEPLLEAFFETKTACDVEGTMSYFSPDLVSYIDATLGWHFDGLDALKAAFEQYMPNWAPPARSYATRILANETSALVHIVPVLKWGCPTRATVRVRVEDRTGV